jgi:hypothetical protein
VFHILTRNNDIENAPLPPRVKAYFKEHSKLPDWADPKLLLTGQDVYRRYGLEVAMLLLYLSLPAAYSCANGAKVLVKTGRLTERQHGKLDRLNYRLLETSQFVINVMQPGAFQGNADGIVTTLKIRLIHAAIRHFIREKGDWNTDEWGEPINQEDMAGTLMSFSSLILHGLENMGAELSPEEQEGYFHCWRVTGHLMGLDPRLIPKDYADGLKMGFQIIGHQSKKSPEGQLLVSSLVDYVNDILPFPIFKGLLPVVLINYFIGENIGHNLTFRQVPRFWYWVITLCLRFFSFLLNLFGIPRYRLVRSRIGKMKQPFLEKIITHFNNHKKIHFDIPPSLHDDWLTGANEKIIGIAKG